MHSRRFYLFAAFMLVSCLGMDMDSSDCDSTFNAFDSLFPTSGQKQIDFFNDSSTAAHLMVFGEVRSPANLVQPGSGRVATIRAMPNEVLTVRAESSEGVFMGLGTCTYAETTAVQGGEIAFTGTAFECSGALFE